MTATSSSWRSGARATTSAPREAITDCRAVKADGSVSSVGVRTQVAPTNSSGSAPSGPSCSDPAIGCPATNRGYDSSATIGPFTPATSVTTSPSNSLAATSSRTAGTTADAGVATKAISADASVPTTSTTPSSAARLALASSRSEPVTCHPRARKAPAIEDPTSPNPTTWARRFTTGPPAG
ncbi:MAG: hypothetical protein ABSH30_06315 [Acidimicrobiales bacterium]